MKEGDIVSMKADGSIILGNENESFYTFPSLKVLTDKLDMAENLLEARQRLEGKILDFMQKLADLPAYRYDEIPTMYRKHFSL